MPVALRTPALFRFGGRRVEYFECPLSHQPLALSAVRSLLIHPEVRLDNDSIALIFDKLVVIDASHSGCVCDSTGVIGA